MRTQTSILRLALTIGVLGTPALAACGGSPTDATYSDLTGSWVGQLQSDGQEGREGQLRLSLTQESADSVGGSGELRWSDSPAATVEVVSGALEVDGRINIWMTVDGRRGWVFLARVSPGRDVMQGRFGTEDASQKLWLYRR